MSTLRILVVDAIWPHPHHEQAANVVLLELMKALAQQPDVHLGFLKAGHDGDAPPTSEELDGIDVMRGQRIEVLTPLSLPPRRPPRSKWERVLRPCLTDFYPDAVHRDRARAAVLDYAPDVLFVAWSEWSIALCADIPIPKFAYYGNPDAKTARAMTEFNYLHGVYNLRQYVASRLLARALERFHLQTMLRYEILGNVAANDAEYYHTNGHPNAFYIRNVWVDRFGLAWREKRRELERADPPMIVANVGQLNGTANTHGLDYLGRALLPALRRAFRGAPFEIHIFGKGTLHPAVESVLRSAPEVRIRGFVPDIDRELLAAAVFLCVNNASAYKVGHTRYLHAWSLGGCVVAHRDATLSMPEIRHGENALLGRSVGEIASYVTDAITNSNLRRRIGEGGYRTFTTQFTAPEVVRDILERIAMYDRTYRPALVV